MPRSERLYLGDIVDAARAIGEYVAGVAAAEFVVNDILRRAVLQRLTEIGEAASHVSPALRARHPSIPWSDIVAFRNIAVHAYFAVDWDLVWDAATFDAPELAARVGAVLDQDDVNSD